METTLWLIKYSAKAGFLEFPYRTLSSEVHKKSPVMIFMVLVAVWVMERAGRVEWKEGEVSNVNRELDWTGRLDLQYTFMKSPPKYVRLEKITVLHTPVLQQKSNTLTEFNLMNHNFPHGKFSKFLAYCSVKSSDLIAILRFSYYV